MLKDVDGHAGKESILTSCPPYKNPCILSGEAMELFSLKCFAVKEGCLIRKVIL
jgi:hypothetical protein